MRKSKQYFLLPLDLETTGFNGIQEVDGKLVNGADHFDILQIAYEVVDPVSMMPYISGNHFIGHSEESGAMARMNPDTRAFHEKIHEGALMSFICKYTVANKVSYELAEKEIIRTLRRILHAHGHILEAYKYGQSYEIVLLGKSCQFDRDFLRAKMPNLSRFLSHRSFDVSVFVLGAQIWGDMVYIQPTQSTHDASEDCRVAMQDASVIKEYLTLMPNPTDRKDKFFVHRLNRYLPFLKKAIQIRDWFK